MTSAIEIEDGIESLVTRSRKLEARLREIDDELRDLTPIPRLPERVVENRLDEWRRLVRGSVTQFDGDYGRLPRTGGGEFQEKGV